MPKKKKEPEEWERFKALTEAVASIPKEEIDKRAEADRRKKKNARRKRKSSIT